MKIECPECGQHFEVDSSMLDRHFRCTECKTFFLGLNAKIVKTQKFVPKASVANKQDAAAVGDNPSEEVLDDIVPDAPEHEAEEGVVPVVRAAEVVSAVKVVSEIKPVQAVKVVAVAAGSAADDAGKDQDAGEETAKTEGTVVKITRDEEISESVVSVSAVSLNRVLALIAVVLGIAALGIIVFMSSRISSLSKDNRMLKQAKDEIADKLDTVADLTDKINKTNEALESLSSVQKKMLEDTALKNKVGEVEDEINAQEESLVACQNEIKELNDKIDELSKKLESLKERPSGRRGSQRGR